MHPNVPHLRFPEFEEEWNIKTLGSLSKGIGDGIHATPIYDDNGSYYFINGNNLSERGINISEATKRVSKEEAYKNNAAILNDRTILLSINGTIGNVALYNNEPIMLGKSACFINVSPHINKHYVYHYLQTNKCQTYFKSELTGTTIKNLSLQSVRNAKIALPSIYEQNRIAKLLDVIDERIATQSKLIEKLESLIKGISNKLFNSKEGMPVRLGAVLKERSEKTKVNNQYTVLSSTVNGLFSQREYFSKDIASENNVGYKIIRLHDVVLSPQNLWMGNINYNDKFDIGIVSPSYKIFFISNNFDKRYVAAMLKTHRALYGYKLISEQGASVVRRNLNLEAFEQLIFKIPTIDKQQEIGKTISLLNSRLETERTLKATYQSQKQYLLRQMFI